jgi:hypothetical protein
MVSHVGLFLRLLFETSYIVSRAGSAWHQF